MLVHHDQSFFVNDCKAFYFDFLNALDSTCKCSRGVHGSSYQVVRDFCEVSRPGKYRGCSRQLILSLLFYRYSRH